MYATTRQFLDYFNLKSLEDLPPLAEIKDLDNLSGDLPLGEPLEVAGQDGSEAAEVGTEVADPPPDDQQSLDGEPRLEEDSAALD